MSIKDDCKNIRNRKDCGKDFVKPKTYQEAVETLDQIEPIISRLEAALWDENIKKIPSAWGGAMIKKEYMENQRQFCFSVIKRTAK